jgi:hypothetical protein
MNYDDYIRWFITGFLVICAMSLAASAYCADRVFIPLSEDVTMDALSFEVRPLDDGDQIALLRVLMKGESFIAGIRKSTCDKGFGPIAILKESTEEFVDTYNYVHKEAKVRSALGDEMCVAIPVWIQKHGVPM